jgi:NADP-dependent 3-hydroxy acid dehydrogenase YdfG
MIAVVSRLASRVVAITGASAGIGRATADACADEGAAIAAFARRGDRLDTLVSSLHARGVRAIAVAGDVAREPDAQRFVSDTIAAFGRLDVMICNAGIGYHGAIDDTPPEVMRRLVDVNLLGTLYTARAAVAIFRRQQSGHLIAVSSISGRRGVGGSSVYSATKAAQIAFIEALRTDFAGTPIQASVILPVRTETEFREAMTRDFGHTVRGRGPRQSAEHVARRIVDCIVSPRAEVYPYPLARWLSVINVVAPATTDRVMRRFKRERTSGAETDGRDR